MSEQSQRQVRDQHRENFDELNRRTEAAAHGRHVRFLNFGYAPLEGESPKGPTLPRLFPKPDSAQLLLQVIGDADLSQCTVIEVGCGRGGNLWFLRRYLGVTATIGLDLSGAAVRFAADDGADPGAYVQGDAERLPFGTGTAATVLSIESASAYPDIERFFREVFRVLRPGGLFLYADAVPTELVPAYGRVVRELGFAVRDERDITPNVVAARDRRGAREGTMLADGGGDERGEWVGRPGSRGHSMLTDGSTQYRLWRLERVAPGSGAGTGAGFSAAERAGQRRWAELSADLLTHLPPGAVVADGADLIPVVDTAMVDTATVDTATIDTATVDTATVPATERR